ncbi:VOC family protein [Aeromicrobium sp. YIM 150415]|nr:VOC family protein [Aeromicrobium sp. YIM 150415]
MVYADPEGGEFCVFLNPAQPVGLKDIVVDAVDHAAIASWWQDVWGGVLGTDDGYTYLDEIPGAPVESFDFVPVPEPKTVKNRVHWDVWLRGGARVEDIVERGGRILRPRGDDLEWTVMADPEGNEFCVFER